MPNEQEDPYNAGYALNYMANKVGSKEIEQIKNEREGFRKRLIPQQPQVIIASQRGPRYEDAVLAYPGGAKYQVRRSALERRSEYKELLNDRRKALAKKLISEK